MVTGESVSWESDPAIGRIWKWGWREMCEKGDFTWNSKRKTGKKMLKKMTLSLLNSSGLRDQ